jgi:hypothetical protein
MCAAVGPLNIKPEEGQWRPEIWQIGSLSVKAGLLTTPYLSVERTQSLDNRLHEDP